MTAVSLPSPNQTQTNDSCFTKVKQCRTNEKAKQFTKAFFWLSGAVTASFIPVLFLNGFVCGSMLFIGTHEFAKAPDILCSQNSWAPIVQSRTWKHLTAGVLISGISWGLFTLCYQYGNLALNGLGATSALSGLSLGVYVTYSNRFCAPLPNPEAEPQGAV